MVVSIGIIIYLLVVIGIIVFVINKVNRGNKGNLLEVEAQLAADDENILIRSISRAKGLLILSAYFGIVGIITIFRGGIIILLIAVFFLLLRLIFVRSYIYITDKRVYGKTAFGTRIDLPFDSISSVGTSWWFGGITFGTSSGRIRFKFIENRYEMQTIINKLLIERNSKNVESYAANSSMLNTNIPDELKKFKDLLDSGIITQEEFDEKKKQLLKL